MRLSTSFAIVVATGIAIAGLFVVPTPACCPVGPVGKPVVNADQTVILLWDSARQTQHFIRKANFKSDADDFGFIVPSPSQPELAESNNDAFALLQKVTEPEIQYKVRPLPLPTIGCCANMNDMKGATFNAPPVRVLEEKEVAGFTAAVLEAKSAAALTGWLKEHGFAYSPEVENWAKPYVEQGWMFTALKISKRQPTEKSVAAAALRISFKTDRPLFPYREPDPKAFARALDMKERLLRIYFLADARYRGELTKDNPWTGMLAWAGPLPSTARTKLLDMLKLPAVPTAPLFLTEFEDMWPYQAAPADVYFSRDTDQHPVKREPIIRYYVSSDLPNAIGFFAIVALAVAPTLVRRRK